VCEDARAYACRRVGLRVPLVVTRQRRDMGEAGAVDHSMPRLIRRRSCNMAP
jgi:hypothetical protein